MILHALKQAATYATAIAMKRSNNTLDMVKASYAEFVTVSSLIIFWIQNEITLL